MGAPRPYNTKNMKQTLTLLRALTRLPSTVHDALIGQLLSDAHAHRSSPTSNTRIEWSFGMPYYFYGSYIGDLFAPYCFTAMSVLESGQHRLKTLSLHVFNVYHALFYVAGPDGRWIKVVPACIDSLMTPMVLAHMIIGDGYFALDTSTVFIYVNAFTRPDCVRLAEAISAIGVRTTVRVDRNGKQGVKQYKLAISKAQLPALRAIVKPFMHPSMLYRLGL